jgi:hypothetical protein
MHSRHTITIELRGTRQDVDALLAEIAEQESCTPQILRSVPVRPSLLHRTPLRQIEMIDVVVAIALNIISAEVHHRIRRFIETKAQEKKVEVKRQDEMGES